MKLSIIPAKAWFIGAAAITAAIGALEVNGRFAAAQEAAGRSGAAAASLDGSVSVSAETLKDVEVMRRVLIREGLGVRASDVRLAFYDVAKTGVHTVTVGAADGTLVPGQGVGFVLRTSDPVAPPPGGSTASPDAPVSAWDEEAAAVDGGSSGGDGKWRADSGARLASVSHAKVYDAEKVRALRDRILEQLARFGSRIRGLTPTDRVSVVVTGGAVFAPTAPSEPNAQSAAPGAADADARGRLLSHIASSANWVLSATNGMSASTTMTISVSFADCDAAAKGTMSREEFRRRAVVSQY